MCCFLYLQQNGVTEKRYVYVSAKKPLCVRELVLLLDEATAIGGFDISACVLASSYQKSFL